MSKAVRIATRGSQLALWQANWVAQQLQTRGLQATLVIVQTQGDVERLPFSEMSGQGFFTKAVQDAVLNQQADIAVHSYKDLPSQGPQGLCIAAVPKRAEAHELLIVHPHYHDPSGLHFPLALGATVGSSAVRRAAQIKQHRPDIGLRELRGNVPTRVERLREGHYHAIVLAAAGIQRLQLDLSDLHVLSLPIQTVVPAPAQGALAIECRQDDHYLIQELRQLSDPLTEQCVASERGLMARLDGGCQLALGAHAQPLTQQPDGWLELVAWYGGHTFKAVAQEPQQLMQTVFAQIQITQQRTA